MNNNKRLHWLAALAILIGSWMLLADADTSNDELRRTVASEQARASRERDAVLGLNWMTEAARARTAQLEWASRLIEAETPGILRVTVLEHTRAICTEAKAAACQVSLVVDDGAAPEATRGPTRRNADARLPSGIRTAKVKLSFNFSPEALTSLLKRVEEGDKLGKVDRLTIAGSRAELQLSFFGTDPNAARALRGAVHPGTDS